MLRGEDMGRETAPFGYVGEVRPAPPPSPLTPRRLATGPAGRALATLPLAVAAIVVVARAVTFLFGRDPLARALALVWSVPVTIALLVAVRRVWAWQPRATPKPAATLSSWWWTAAPTTIASAPPRSDDPSR
jgi:hypothetical protein